MIRVFADELGESHIEDAELEFDTYATAGSVFQLSKVATNIAEVRIVEDEPDFSDFHVAPRRQFVIHLNGGTGVTTSDGAHREIRAGELFFVEDTTGKGHQTTIRRPETGKRTTLFIPVDDDWYFPST